MSKDKCAAALKKRRRMEKAAEELREKRQFLASFDEHCRERGVKPRYNKEEAWRACKRLKVKLAKRTIMTAFVAALYWLARYRQWGAYRLTEYTKRVKDCICLLEERHLGKLCEDLSYDAAIDLKELCRDIRCATEYTECIMADAAYGLTAVLWPLYEYYGWRKRRMNAAAEGVIGIVRDIAADKDGLKRYISRIELRTGVHVDIDGQTWTVDEDSFSGVITDEPERSCVHCTKGMIARCRICKAYGGVECAGCAFFIR